MKRMIAAALLLAAGLLQGTAGAAEESLEAIERDLSGILKEMDAMSAELDRIREMTEEPKATGLRVEIHRGADVPAPVSGRFLVGGKVEGQREWSRAERESFAGGQPVVFHLPLLPGTHAARIEIAHPSWKAAPAADFRVSVKKGETILMKMVLSLPPGNAAPALSPMEVK